MKLRALIASFAAFAGVTTVQAAVDAGVYSVEIHDITCDADVVTEGEAAYPVAITGYFEDARKTSGVIDGIDFRSIYSTANDGVLTPYWRRSTGDGKRDTGSCCTIDATESFSTTYRQILNGCNTGGSVTLLQLTPGEAYLLQVWATESSEEKAALTTTVTVGDVTSAELKVNTGAGLGQYALVRFVALEESVKVTVSRFNAMQLRKVARPSVTAQTWAPVNESTVWDATGANWLGSTAEETLWSAGAGLCNAAVFEGPATVSAAGCVYASAVSSDSLLTVTNGEVVVGQATIGGLSLVPAPTTDELVAANGDHSVQVKLLFGGKLATGALTGAGSLAGDGCVEATVAEGVQTFAGSLRGALSLTKKGSGTLELQGPSFFSGAFAIEEGMVRFGIPAYADLVKFDFDCSQTANWTFNGADENGVTTVKQLKTATGACSNAQLGYSHFDSYGEPVAYVASGDYFNGLPYLRLVNGASFSYSNSGTSRGRAESWLFVYQNKTEKGTWQTLLKEGNNSSNNGYCAIDEKGKWWSRCNGTDNSTSVYVDGVLSRDYTPGKKSVFFSCHTVSVNDNRYDIIGTSFDGALAQAIGFTSRPTLELVNSITMEMMWKWNLTDKTTYQPIPATADLVVAKGATLDLGKMTGMTVKSVSLAEGATLAFDALPQDGVLFNLSEPVVGKSHPAVKLVVGGEAAPQYRLTREGSTLKVERVPAFVLVFK